MTKGPALFHKPGHFAPLVLAVLKWLAAFCQPLRKALKLSHGLPLSRGRNGHAA